MKLFKTVLIFLLLIAGVNFGNATVFQAQENYGLSKDQKIDDDLIVAGNTLKIDGAVSGNLITACRYLTQNGTVSGSLFNGSQFADIFGKINGSVTNFSQHLTISGQVKRNVIACGQNINLASVSTVEGDATLCGAEILVDGVILKGLKASGERIVISGMIKGDVNLNGKSITILATAEILGNLTYKSPKEAKIASGAKIAGATKWTEFKAKKPKKLAIGRKFSWVSFLFLLASMATGIVLMALFKNQVQKVNLTIQKSFWKSLGSGFVLAIVSPIGAIILMVTLVGIPLAVITGFLYLILFYIAKIFTGLALGEKVIQIFKKGNIPLGWSLIVGLVLLYILVGLPYVGWLIYTLAFFIGLGGIVLSFKQRKIE
ncbi:MAG: hypothetical protein A2145_00520 [candidate division Zixibacteria bacterium RBG_16_40_9]|nr:MAG: hypothetical protein A2145_00520 [candidate division Zixibacteria bacterium RBG_16_40_9]